jgi:hypothetical protein
MIGFIVNSLTFISEKTRVIAGFDRITGKEAGIGTPLTYTPELQWIRRLAHRAS